MQYCKNCEYLTGSKCIRPVDDPVYGKNTLLNASALGQRLDKSYYNYLDTCGIEAKYFKLREVESAVII